MGGPHANSTTDHEHYRRNRFIVCTICALVTLILRWKSILIYYFGANLNHHRTAAFANHAVDALDVLHPLPSVGRNILLPLLELPCATAHLPLRRAKFRPPAKPFVLSGWVKEGILYCSSILAPAIPHIRQRF
ncbi:hypothetical protein KCP77_13185 [Salmonella enterica subsp. enterica]|nr:hypothetical protein KCP77_13185 [Salmonella enterica subsp. enterica]